MRAAEVPLNIVEIQSADPKDAYDRKLILVRADQHVAWRGDAVPDRVAELVDRLRGRSDYMPGVKLDVDLAAAAGGRHEHRDDAALPPPSVGTSGPNRNSPRERSATTARSRRYLAGLDLAM
jgi:hypothetical protein